MYSMPLIQGFKQLMATLESARIQTAARALGVAVNAQPEQLGETTADLAARLRL